MDETTRKVIEELKREKEIIDFYNLAKKYGFYYPKKKQTRVD